jgi:hypothetical protein
MKQKISIVILFLSAFAAAFGQVDTVRTPDPGEKEFQFIGYSFTRLTTSNVAPSNDLLQGQVIGRLFGTNSTFTFPRTAMYTEQRFVPYMVYKPSLLDGIATFRLLMKIDYTWGDVNYGTGGNRGGAAGAGQVNLQTLLANVDIHPTGEHWNVVVGLQRMFDNVRDPNLTSVPTALSSGYKLAFFGNQATGVNFFATPSPVSMLRLGVFQLYENAIPKDDDVLLYMADFETRLNPYIEWGTDLWYVHDRGDNAGGVAALGQGLTSGLADYNGATRVHFPGETQSYKADIAWIGTHAAYNRDFAAGRWWIDGFAIANLGTADTLGTKSSGKAVDIFGVAANAFIGYKYGTTVNDRITFEGIFTTGDANNAADGKLGSVITGNVYGTPLGIYGNHHALLLFPDTKVVNRYYSAVHDISNMGYGTTGVFLNASKDLIQNTLNLKLGAATAFSNVTPPGGGNMIGSEVNFELLYTYKVLFTFGLHGGYLFAGDFYDSPVTTNYQGKPKNPWVLFSTMSWYMF